MYAICREKNCPGPCLMLVASLALLRNRGSEGARVGG